MAKMPGVLRPRPRFSDAELAIARERTAARLADLFGHGEDSDGHPSRPGRRPPIVVEGESDLIGLPSDAELDAVATGEAPAADVVGVMESPSETGELVSIVVASSPDAELVGVMGAGTVAGEPLASDGPHDLPATGTVGADETPTGAAAAAAISQLTLEAVQPMVPDAPLASVAAEPDLEPEAPPPASPAIEPSPKVAAVTPAAAKPTTRKVAAATPAAAKPAARGTKAIRKRASAKKVPARPAAAKATAARPAAATKSAAAGPAATKAPAAKRAPATSGAVAASPARPAPVVLAALCPYCALLLQPPPTASRKCQRCRQQIVVKRVEGRLAYLTEAAVAVFEAERRKTADSGRLARERERWLKLAVAAGAPAQKADRLAAAHLSQEVVDAAHQLYAGTVDRAFQAAKRDHRWEEASRIRRDQATAVHRLAGAPTPPPEDLLAVYREGVAAELRGLAEIVRDAELVSAMCCDACRADNGRIVAIGKELATPSLPHQGCPKVFCRCSWDLATRDRELVLRYLRRHPRPAGRPAARAAAKGKDISTAT